MRHSKIKGRIKRLQETVTSKETIVASWEAFIDERRELGYPPETLTWAYKVVAGMHTELAEAHRQLSDLKSMQVGRMISEFLPSSTRPILSPAPDIHVKPSLPISGPVAPDQPPISLAA